ncbi:SDR family oxidoreductase [Facilibium subflavum]|uniref:SDR family oxidoreductase n=1 Tax=Facilibium subflavum TaxID=2219058 RepID=UPI000E657229|nr:SDR family oxidoreductase [Facilibium subflavum]
MTTLEGKVIVITGATRGVGKAIAIKAAEDGAHVVIIGKTDKPHPKLPGTVHSAADEVKAAGAKSVFPIVCDVRDLDALKKHIEQIGQHFGHIDIVVNNASALYLQSCTEVSEKAFDLMHQIIVRSSFFMSQYAYPFLKKSSVKQILNIAPKVDMKAKWFGNHTAYTLCKFASSMMVTGLANEFKADGIHVNALWPATLLNTAAVKFVLGGDQALAHTRDPRIMADAAYHIFTALNVSGEYFLDVDLIKKMGKNPDDYATVAGNKPFIDLYVEEAAIQ